MALDRDLGVSVASQLASEKGGARGEAWEMLAATGVRGLRALSEARAWERMLLTEANPAAFAVLERNVDRFSSFGARGARSDARTLPAAGPFDFVDLDPYGSPVPFAEALFAAVKPGGIIAVTATDTRVLAGVDRGVCERRYGARPLRGRLAPEAGLRILIAWLARRAAARGSSIRPLLSYVHDHYVRTYLGLSAGAGEPPVQVVFDGDLGPPLPGKGPFGPLWVGPLFEAEFVRALKVPPNAAAPGLLARLLERFAGEARVDRPFFYEPNEIARSLGLASPPPVGPLLEALEAGGWPSARSHARPGSFRSTASWADVAATARSLGVHSNRGSGPVPPVRGGDPSTPR